MRRLIFAAVLCAFVVPPSWADYFAGVDNLNQTGSVGVIQYSSGNGGEFTISGSTLSVSAYKAGVTSGITGTANSFQTFCVEGGEFTASPIDVVVSTTWAPDGTPTVPQWGAGVVTPASHAVMGGMSPTGDDLNPQTAYLYTLFAKGALPGYVYGVGRGASAGDLQKAIWFLEGEPTGGMTAQANAWVQQAVDATNLSSGAFVPNLTSPFSNVWGQTIGDVRILNIYAQGTYGTANPVLKQDQLYLVPVPAAFLLGLLGLSAAGVKLRKYA